MVARAESLSIEKFGLRRIFQLFVSSVSVGLRKPESGIYRLALEITQRPADECVSSTIAL